MNKFNLNSVFDKALDSVIDGLEGTSLVDRARAAASDLLSEEYKAPTPSQGEGGTSADLSNLQNVYGFWRLFNLQVECVAVRLWERNETAIQAFLTEECTKLQHALLIGTEEAACRNKACAGGSQQLWRCPRLTEVSSSYPGVISNKRALQHVRCKHTSAGHVVVEAHRMYRRRAEQAEAALRELAGALGQAPDPTPFLEAIPGLQRALAEEQRQNRKLVAARDAADAEDGSAAGAVLRCRELERQLAELQAEAAGKV